MKEKWAVLGTVGFLVLLAAFFAGGYFYAEQKAAATAAALADAEEERLALFTPQITASAISCELSEEEKVLSARAHYISIQASDPNDLMLRLQTQAKKYPGANLVLTSHTSDGISVTESYTSLYLDGFIPLANSDEFLSFVKNLEDKKDIFIPEVRNTTIPAREAYTACEEEKNYVQSLALKEALYIERLKDDSFLSSQEIDNLTEDVVSVRANAAYVLNRATLPNPLRIHERLESTIFNIRISDLKG
jgi:hypothetical protein